MKAILLFLFLVFVSSVSVAQSPAEKLAAKYSNASSSIPADQVFLHTDRNLYHSGDTIRFQAYIRDRQTGIFETKSISLYTLLLSPAHKTIDSARFRISNSTSSGWLKVPDEIPNGDYSILSFTSGMMNYDPGFIFSAPIRIDKLRPIQQPSDKKTEKDKTPAFQLQVTQESVNLTFLPEGGTFIYGIKQRLAFNAVTSVGTNIKSEGEIINQKGEKICSFKPGLSGPGMVELTPVQGDTYFATLKGDEFKGMKWPLPVPENSGIALKVNGSEKGIVSISVDGKGVTGSTYLLSLVMNNILVLSKEFKIDSAFKFKVSTEELPQGTAYITVFNIELKPVAERLVFVNVHKKMNIRVTTSASSYSRGEETELTINSTNTDGNNVSSIVSVAVIDSISGYFDRFPLPDIESMFLFDRDFYDNLPPKMKLSGLSGLDEQSIDLILMTYGWRKFRMREATDSTVVRDYKNYDFLKIKNPGTEKKTRNEINGISIEGNEPFSLIPDSNNEAVLPFDSIGSSVRQIMILPDKNKLKNVYPVVVEFPENKAYTDKAKQIKFTDEILVSDISLQKKTETDFGLDSAIMIDPITIKGNKAPPPIPYVNKYQEQFAYASTTTISKKEMTGCLNLEDILARLHPYILDTRNKMMYLRPGGRSIAGVRSLSGKPQPALFVVDDVPLIDANENKSYSLIATIPASLIESVTVLKGDRGFTFYGYDANGGVVFVTTSAKQQMDGKYPLFKVPDREKDDLLKAVRIFRSEIEYYVPSKEEVATIPEYQFRPTILWKNEVLLDGSGPVKLKYPNNMVKGTVMVIINGVSFTNQPGSGSYKYSVK